MPVNSSSGVCNSAANTRHGVDFILSKAVAPPVIKGLMHSDDLRFECINALLPPPKKAPVFKLPQVPRVHVRQFAQVPLAHGPVVVDGPLQPPRPHAILIAFDAVEDLLAARVEGLWRHELPREVLLPMCLGLRQVRLLTLLVCGGRPRPRFRCTALADRRFEIFFKFWLRQIARRGLGTDGIRPYGSGLLRLEKVEIIPSVTADKRK